MQITDYEQFENIDKIEISGGEDINKLYILPDNTLVRVIPKSRTGRWAYLFEFMKTEEFEELNGNCIPKYDLITEDDAYCLYRVQLIRNITRPSEWTQKQYNEIALLIHDINSKLNKFKLNETHFHNFSYLYNKPMLLDIGSIDCTMYEYASTTMSCNIKNYKIKMLSAEIDWEKIRQKITPQNQWDNYPDSPAEAILIKQKIQEKGWYLGTIIDIGGNDGSMTDHLQDHWEDRIIIDNSENALDRGRLKNKTTTAKIDLTKGDCIGLSQNCITEGIESTHKYHVYSKWMERLKGETSFLSSIIHHIIRADGNLELISQLCNLGTEYCFIEMIDHTDQHVSGWYGPEINIHNLMKYLNNWTIEDTIKDYNGNTRTWYLLKNNSPNERNQ